MVQGMKTPRLDSRGESGSGGNPYRRAPAGEAGLTLIEVVVAGAILSVALLAAHYSATLAWALHREGSVSSEETIRLWSRCSRFRARLEEEGSPLMLKPGLRPVRQVVLEENGLEWEVIGAR